MSKTICASIFAVAWLTVANSPRVVTAVVLDDYSVGPLAFSSFNSASNDILQSNLDPEHVFGGTRSVSFYFVGPAPGNSMTLDTTAGELRVNPSLQCCTELTVSYGSPTTPLHLNLTADGSDRFLFKFGQIDKALVYAIPFFTLTDSQNHSFQPLRNVPLPANPQSGFSLEVPFAQLTGINVADIRSLSYQIGRYPPGASFSLDDIRTVPEPATAGVVAMAVIATALHWRKRHI
jgi:hypothetical protein